MGKDRSNQSCKDWQRTVDGKFKVASYAGRTPQDIRTARFMAIIDASLSWKEIPFRLIAAHNLLHFYF